MSIAGAGLNGRYGAQHYGLHSDEARQDHRAPGRVERPYPRSVANAADPYDWIGKAQLEPVFTSTEVAASLAVDHGRRRVVGNIGLDFEFLGQWWRSGQANRDLSRAFCISGVLVFLAHISAFGWILAWNVTARLMGVQ